MAETQKTGLGMEETERYARHLILREIGVPGQQKLKAARCARAALAGTGSCPIWQQWV